MKTRTWLTILAILAFAASLAPLPLAAQEDLFGGLELAGSNQPRSTGSGASQMSRGDADVLRLLASACDDAMKIVKERSKDKKGRTFLDPDYSPYEMKMDSTDHLMLAGTLYRNSFKGFSSNKNPDHDFRFDTPTLLEMYKPVPYLDALAAHASRSGQRAIAVFKMVLEGVDRNHVKGPEKDWNKIPPAGANAARIIYCRLWALQQLVGVSRELGQPLQVPSDTAGRLDKALSLLQTGLGLSRDGHTVDAERAAAGITCVRRGTNVVVSRIPGVTVKDHLFGLKADLAAELAKVQPRGSARPTPADKIRLTAWKAVEPLQKGATVKPSINPDGTAEKQLVNQVLQTGAAIRGMLAILRQF